MKIFTWPVVAGAALGIVAPLLTYNGNPGNMGFCAACFLRDTAGAVGLHHAAPLQYIRPEIIGLILGALISALFSKEFRPRGGSSPFIRMILGFFAMLGALTFLGCPWRAYLCLGGGDLTSIAGIAGLFAGVLGGIFFAKRDFSLGKAVEQNKYTSYIAIAVSVLLFIFLITRFSFGEGLPIFFSAKGSGAQHANLWLSLGVGLLIGVLMQRSRFCSIGAFRNFILFRDSALLNGVIAIVVFAMITNALLGQFHLGVEKQPIAHNQYLWNFLGMALCGLCFSLGGGCPGKQLVHVGEGNNDATFFIVGMLLGAAAAHNLTLAASGAGISNYTPYALLAGFVFCIYIGFTRKASA
ncbi:YedE family putative selenium transporter [Pasteurella multocida]|uniref:YedE family putative selenium transporter n=1 Tax=Pasteurella multocida TaxID=747 RepID=UPI00111AA157|nr:YedE family putative selenium transporter [Pasteurella multocida]MDY0631278.1 YedE family putative selenium transporter [Pasteurella multocida]QDA12458.1 YedE-related selenium metabolism membrane protein [Pasteurella multocida subsp. multocida]